jgi:hypothetical protein
MDKDIDLLTPALPPYSVVISCGALGFDRPQDSPWKQIPRDSPYYCKELLPCPCADSARSGPQWTHRKGSRQVEIFMHRCLFNHNGSSDIFRIGQCPACNTIYWSED